jgi:hypothetical protein
MDNTSITWLENWDEARARAASEGKEVLLFLYSPT